MPKLVRNKSPVRSGVKLRLIKRSNSLKKSKVKKVRRRMMSKRKYMSPLSPRKSSSSHDEVYIPGNAFLRELGYSTRKKYSPKSNSPLFYKSNSPVRIRKSRITLANYSPKSKSSSESSRKSLTYIAGDAFKREFGYGTSPIRKKIKFGSSSKSNSSGSESRITMAEPGKYVPPKPLYIKDSRSNSPVYESRITMASTKHKRKRRQ